MKILKCAVLVFVLFSFPALSSGQTLGSLRISLIEGDVQVRAEDAGEWVPASINMPLMDGDRIWVPEEGRTELQLRDGTFLRLDENSALEILTLEKDSCQFYLTEGRSYTNFRGLRGSFLQIDTPDSSVRVYDRSNFRIETTQDGYTDISVYRGVVYAESREGETGVEGGNILSLQDGSYAELSPLGPPDEWERWNRRRDRRFAARRPPSRYLPAELEAYSADFEENGRWVQVREYGYVWTPKVVVSAGWAPYRVGRWVWMGGDYVWVSYEPWGWAPYHYGRWAFISAIGWCWVPPARGAVYWGPGFVGWVRTPTYVSWVPLAPGEIYYGHGYYGPHSVNVTQVNITHIDVHKIVYKNVRIQNAVTVVHQDTFVKGRKVEVNVRENPFLKEKISLGRPDIKPEKATVMPVIKEIPQTKRPPEPIREIKVKELKQERPLVREKGASVLEPKSLPKKMPVRPTEKAGGERSREIRRTEKGFEKPRDVKPLERKSDKTLPVGKGGEQGKDLKPPEKGLEKTAPFEKGVEKPKEPKPSERAVEKTREIKPPEKGLEKPGPVERQFEKPKEIKPVERGVEKPKEFKSPEESAKPREFRPPERGVERSGPVERGVEKSREVKPSERAVEKPREIKPQEKVPDKPGSVERQIEKPREFKPAEESTRSREFRPPERGVERSAPVERGVEKSREVKPSERALEKPREVKPQEREVEKLRESRPPTKGVEKVREPVEPERGSEKLGPVEERMEKPREPKPPAKEMGKQGEGR